MKFLVEVLMGKGGLASLMLVSFLEASIFPIPPDTLLIPLSILKPGKALLYALITTVFSSIGALFGHWLGKVFGRPLLQKISNRDLAWKTETLFQRYGAWAIAVAGFTPIPFKLATIASGVFGVSKLTTLTASILGRGLRFGTEAIVILLLGPAAGQFLNRYLTPLSVAVVLLFLGILLLGKGKGIRAFYKSIRDRLRNVLSYIMEKIDALGPKRPLFYALLSLFCAATMAFMEIGEDIGLSWQVALDNKLIAFVQKSPLDSFYSEITQFGSLQWILCLMTVFILYSFLRKRAKDGLLLAAQTTGAWLLNLILKQIYARPRPMQPLVLESGYSYPSGHAMVGLVFYLLLAWALSRGLRRGSRFVLVAGGALLIFLIGLSRIYLGVHYPTDVLGGFMAGLAWICLWKLVALFR